MSICTGIGIFHHFGQWEDVTSGNPPTPLSSSGAYGECKIQMRVCVKCGFVELKFLPVVGETIVKKDAP